MKKKLFLIQTLVILTLFLTLSMTCYAAGSKKHIGSINNRNVLTASMDLTGDGKADKVTFKVTGKYASFQTTGGLYISVNGKTAQKIKITSPYVDLSYFALSKNVQLIRIQTGGYMGCARDYFFIQYNKSTNKFKIVLNEKLGGLSCFESYDLGSVTIVDSKTMKVKYFTQPYLSGPIYIEYTYVYSNGVMKRKSNTATATSMYYKNDNMRTQSFYQDGYQNYFYRNQYIAKNSLRLINPTTGKYSFTLPKKGVATLKYFYSSGTNAYLGFSYSGKTAYIKIGPNQMDVFWGVSRRYVN